MPHSLRAKIKGLRYKRVITDKNCERLCKAVDNENVLDKIRAEIEQAADKQFQIAMSVADLNERYTHVQMENAYRHSLNIIDKYKMESEVSDEDSD